MDSTTVAVIAGVVVAIAAIIVGLVWWKQTQKENQRRQREAEEVARRAREAEEARLAGEAEEARRAREVEEARRHWQMLRHEGAVGMPRVIPTRQALSSDGRMMLVGVGTPGMNTVERLLTEMARIGLNNEVGAILIINNDRKELDNFRPPAVFDDRVVRGSCPSYAGGFTGRNPDQVRDGISKWGPETEHNVEKACELHRRINGGSAPSSVLLAFSGSGHAAVGSYVTRLIHTKFPEPRIFGMTYLPKEGRSREYLRHEYPRFVEAGLHGCILIEGEGEDVVTVDTALSYMIAGFSNGAVYDDRANSSPLNNIFAYAFPEDKHGFLVFQTSCCTVPGWSLEKTADGLPEFYTTKHLVVQEFLNAAYRLEKEEGLFSAKLPTYEPGTVVHDLFMANLQPNDLLSVKDGVADALRSIRDGGNDRQDERTTFAKRYVGRNYKAIYAPMVRQFSPDQPVAHVWAIRLISVRITADTGTPALTIDDIVNRSISMERLLTTGNGNHSPTPVKEAALSA